MEFELIKKIEIFPLTEINPKAIVDDQWERDVSKKRSFSFLWYYFNVLNCDQNEMQLVSERKIASIFKVNNPKEIEVSDCRKFLSENGLDYGGLPVLYSLFERNKREEIDIDGWLLSPTFFVRMANKITDKFGTPFGGIDADEIPPYNMPHKPNTQVIPGLYLSDNLFNMSFLGKDFTCWYGDFYLVGIQKS
jgi:hypothetical protein